MAQHGERIRRSVSISWSEMSERLVSITQLKPNSFLVYLNAEEFFQVEFSS